MAQTTRRVPRSDAPTASGVNVVEVYLSAMEAHGRAEATLLRARLSLRRLGEHLGHDVTTATPLEIEAWLHSLSVSPASRRMYLNDLKGFFRWARRRGVIEVDPTEMVDGYACPKYLPRPISDDDLARAVALAQPTMRLTLKLAALAGLRCGEIAGLAWDDVDLVNGLVRVTGKGNKTRVIPLHPDLAVELEGGGTGPVVGYRGRHVGARAISQRVSQYLHGLGIDATAHRGRHWFGTNAYRSTQDIVAVAALMGHSSIHTTQVYVQGSADALVAAVGGLSIGAAS